MNENLSKLLSNKKLLVALAIVLLIIFFSCSGRGYKDTAIESIEAILEGNAKDFVCLCSEDLIDEFMMKNDCETKKILIKDLENKMEEIQEDYKGKFGKKWKYEIEYVDSYKEDDLCIVYLEVTYKGKNWIGSKIEESESIEVALVKNGRNWFLDSFPNI